MFSKMLNFLDNRYKAFTLIELLVVIAIIGLLSSVVLVSTSGLRDRAEITKIMQWAKSLNSLLGSQAAGIWNFDEGVMDSCSDDKDACDISGTTVLSAARPFIPKMPAPLLIRDMLWLLMGAAIMLPYQPLV
jgi:prepilin-type N-terminal cleavage/methylation domain-containing protein